MSCDTTYIRIILAGDGIACAVYKLFPGTQTQAPKAMGHDRQASAPGLLEGRHTRADLQRAAGAFAIMISLLFF
jgi:hypothetical protein